MRKDYCSPFSSQNEYSRFLLNQFCTSLFFFIQSMCLPLCVCLFHHPLSLSFATLARHFVRTKMWKLMKLENEDETKISTRCLLKICGLLSLFAKIRNGVYFQRWDYYNSFLWIFRGTMSHTNENAERKKKQSIHGSHVFSKWILFFSLYTVIISNIVFSTDLKKRERWWWRRRCRRKINGRISNIHTFSTRSDCFHFVVQSSFLQMD